MYLYCCIQLVLYRFESSLYCSVAITFLLLQLIPSINTFICFNLYSWFLVLPSAVLFTMVWRITCWTCDCQPLPSPKELIKTDLWVRLKPLTHHKPPSPCSRGTVTMTWEGILSDQSGIQTYALLVSRRGSGCVCLKELEFKTPVCTFEDK